MAASGTDISFIFTRDVLAAVVVVVVVVVLLFFSIFTRDVLAAVVVVVVLFGCVVVCGHVPLCCWIFCRVNLSELRCFD